MKKNVLFGMMALAMGAMTACSVEEVVDQAETNYIGFDPFANKVSRATTNAQGLGHSSFSVFGRYAEGAGYVTVFSNKEVEWSKPGDLDAADGSWTYTPLVPWVSGKNYVFAAIAPYNASYTAAAYNYDSNQYTLGDITLDATFSGEKYTNQIDYMTADKVEQNSGTSTSVSFTFNHIASKIDFKFQPQNTGGKAWPSDVKIDIKSITLSSVATTKSYTNGAWVDAPAADGRFSVSLSDNNSTTYEPSSTEADKVSELTGKFSWLVVPQSEADASGRKLAITFDVFTKDATGAYNVQVLTDESATIDIDTQWNPNTVYTYTVYIGSDILGQNPYITFDVASANWSTPNQESDLNVPTTTAP